MTLAARILTAFLLVSAIGCLKPQKEYPGAQTPAERATPPETRSYMATDSPTNSRSSAARPAEPEKGKKK